MISGKELTTDEKSKFIKKLKLTNGNVTKAAKAAGIGRTAAYDHKKADEDFSKEWDEVCESVADDMEQELYRRAVKGTLKPVYYKGIQVGSIREYSDSLMIAGLKAKRPEKYRERFDIDANVKGSLDVSIDKAIAEIYGDENDDGDKS